MNIKELLPIGTVVLLKDGEKRLMISGIKQTDASGEGEEYDYLGVLYPEGHIGEEYQFLFNHDNIKKIVFRGYEDDERTNFLERLSVFYTREKAGD